VFGWCPKTERIYKKIKEQKYVVKMAKNKSILEIVLE
jgi:hypothetical protein